MTRLASRFGSANNIRRERPLTIEELFRTVPSVFSEENMNLVAKSTLTFLRLLYSIVYRKKVFTRSLHAKEGRSLDGVQTFARKFNQGRIIRQECQR